MIRYIENNKWKTNLQEVLKRHGIKQYELAQESDMDTWLISEVCTGKKKDIMLSTAMRICDALNDLLIKEEIEYNLHDIFGEQKQIK